MRIYEAHLDIDTRCNYRCRFCPNFNDPQTAGKGPFPPEPFEEALAVLTRLCWHLFVSCAGEPLLHPAFDRMIAAINRHCRKTDVTLVTNGRLLNERAQTLLADSAITRVNVSLSTLDPDRYANLYGCRPTDRHIVLRQLSAFADKLQGRSFPRLFITALAMRSTLDGLEELAAWAGAHKLDGMKVQWLEPYGNPAMQAEDVRSDPHTLRILTALQERCRREHLQFDYPLTTGIPKTLSFLYGTRYVKNRAEHLLFGLRKVLAARRKSGCRMAGLDLNLLADGSVQICPNNAEVVGVLPGDSLARIRRCITLTSRRLSDTPSPACRACHFFRDAG